MIPLLVTILLQQAPEITLPDAKTIAEWSAKKPEYKTILDAMLQKEIWAAAAKSNGEKLGALRLRISVKIVETDEAYLASTDTISEEENGTWREVDAVVSINLRALCKLEREKIDAPKVKLEERFPVYAKIVPHELAHALQGPEKSPEWFTEGLASWAGEDPYFTRRYHLTHKTTGKLEEASGDDAYGRGHLFFRWLEKKCGRAAFKTLHQLVHVDGVECKAALEKITKLKWAEILTQEQAASSKGK